MKKKVLIVGSSVRCKGGIASVISNYMNFQDWGDYDLIHVTTHVDGNKFLKLLVFIVGYFRVLFTLVFRNITIVHVHMSMRASFVRKTKIVKLAKFFKKIVIIHNHGSEIFDYYHGLSRQKQEEFIKVMSLADMNIVLSKKIQSSFSEISNNIKTTVVYNAVPTFETNLYNKTGDILLFFGRIGSRKGAYDLVECAKRLNDKIEKRYVFMFCGDGDIDGLKQLVSQEGLSERCIVHGWISSKEEKEAIFANTILNILPSYNEGLPMTILETMSFGIPNLSTKIASIPEVIDETNGYLIVPGDIDSMSRIIESFLKSEKTDMSRNAYHKINDYFSIEQNVAKIIELYRVLEERRNEHNK